MQIQYVGGPVYCLALLGFKVALLTSYLRIAGVVKLYRKVIIAAIVVCVINQLIFAVIISVSCIPVRSLFLLDLRDSNQVQVAKQWDSSIKGKCIDTIPFYFALAGTSIGLDLIIIALPLPVLWKLQLRLKQRIILAALFALGFFVTVIQIIRIFTVKDLKTYTDSKNIVIWSCVEVSLGVRKYISWMGAKLSATNQPSRLSFHAFQPTVPCSKPSHPPSTHTAITTRRDLINLVRSTRLPSQPLLAGEATLNLYPSQGKRR